MAEVPYTTSDLCWCQPFDGPVHPQCPMHGEQVATDQQLTSECVHCGLEVCVCDEPWSYEDELRERIIQLSLAAFREKVVELLQVKDLPELSGDIAMRLGLAVSESVTFWSEESRRS